MRQVGHLLDSGGKVSILEGHITGHCGKKSSCEHVCNFEKLPICNSLNIELQNTVIGNKERELSYS